MIPDDLPKSPGGDGFLEEIQSSEVCGTIPVFGEDVLGGDDHSGLGVLGAHIHDEVDAVSVGQVDINDEELDVEGGEEQSCFVE